MKNKEIQAINELKEYLKANISQGLKNNIQILVQGFNELDHEVKQKDQVIVQKDSVINQKTLEVQSKDSVLVQKEREEFIEVLQRLEPSYTKHIGDWPDNIYKKAVKENNIENIKLISESLPILKQRLLTKEFITVLNQIDPINYKIDINQLHSHQFSSLVSNWPDNIYKQAVIENNHESNKLITDSLPILKGRYLLKNEFIVVLHKLYPESYPEKFEEWSASRGKELIDNEDYTTINSILPIYRQELNKKLAVQKENELEKLKEVIVFKEIEIQNKDQLLLAKELEKQELARQKEIEKEELLAQKELELVNKSLIKNQVVKETEKLLTEQDIRLQNLLELNGKLDAKMEYARKEIEIREAEKNILSKMLIQKHETLKVLLVQKENEVNEKSFEKNLLINQLREEIEGLNKQIWEHNQHITHSILLDDVGCQPGESLLEKQILESLNLSSINLSFINHGEQNQIVVNIIGNFDINNVHTTNSVLISGEESSFDII
jgi:hypothetical protein